jgi:hypothetical protein
MLIWILELVFKKETPDNPSKGSLKFKGKLDITDKIIP